jgi:hypothetical protein
LAGEPLGEAMGFFLLNADAAEPTAFMGDFLLVGDLRLVGALGGGAR